MKKFTIGVQSVVLQEIKKPLEHFLAKHFKHFEWEITQNFIDFTKDFTKKNSDAKQNIDFIIKPYDEILQRPLSDKRLVATSFPMRKRYKLALGEDGFVFVFLRTRKDIISLFADCFGKVHFVGAGAGNKELLTIKGMQSLAKADIIIFDHLLDKQILTSFVNDNATLLPLTKYGARTQKNLVSQDEINEAILRYSLLLKNVVRLKGGDCFVFGRGAEECEYLLPFNIDYEVVPGISSMLSALSYSGIPLTHRDYNSGFIAITGYNKKCAESEYYSKCNEEIATKINFALDSKLMVVLFMSLTNWANFAYLIKEQNAPVALIESGAYPHQRTFVTTVVKANSIIQNKSLKSPTLITIGNNVKMHSTLQWFEKLPLYKVNILCISSDKLSKELYDAFANNGAFVKLCKLYHLVPKSKKSVSPYLKSLKEYDYIVITSRNAFDFLMMFIKELAIDIRALPKIIVSGAKTKAEFEKIGIQADIVPKRFSSDGIVEKLKEIDISKSKFLFPKSSLADGTISSYIKEQNGFIDEFILYENKEIRLSQEEKEELIAFEPNYIVFTSSSGVRLFYKTIYKQGMDFIAIPMGNKTKDALQKHNAPDIILPKSFTTEGITKALLQKQSSL